MASYSTFSSAEFAPFLERQQGNKSLYLLLSLPLKINKLKVMKKRRLMKFALLSLAMTAVTHAKAQTTIYYSYDASGNRITRTTNIQRTRSVEPEQNTIAETFNPGRSVTVKQHTLQDKVIVNIEGWDSDTAASISIFKLSGIRLQWLSIKQATTEIDLSSYATGCYIMQITVGEYKETWKIIKN